MGLNAAEVIDAAATKPYGFMPFYPGAGVGGHCIPCDPHYLLWHLRAERQAAPMLAHAMLVREFPGIEIVIELLRGTREDYYDPPITSIQPCDCLSSAVPETGRGPALRSIRGRQRVRIRRCCFFESGASLRVVKGGGWLVPLAGLSVQLRPQAWTNIRHAVSHESIEDGWVRRVRIAYLPPRLTPGGAERQMLALAERLPRDRFEVEFLVLSGPGVYEERATAAGVPIRFIGEAAVGGQMLPARLWHRASKARRFVSSVRSGRFDVVDAWLYPADVLAALLRPLTRTPVVISGRRNVDPQNFFRPFERWIETLVGGMTDVVVANSAAVAAHAVSGGVAPEKLRIIRNGVVVPEPVSEAERAARRHTVGVDDPNEIVIGCIANYSPVKRHDLIIEAFAALQDQDRSLRLVLVGEGPMRPTIEHQVRELGLESRVRLHGSELNPERLYPAFDVAVQASSREGLPNALLEAGAAGRPMVATAAGGTDEIVIDGQTGLLIPVDDGAALTEAMRRMVSDAELRQRLGRAAREHVAATFDMDRFVAEFAVLYEEQVAARKLKRKASHPQTG